MSMSKREFREDLHPEGHTIFQKRQIKLRPIFYIYLGSDKV
jgi:hypothetical protein